MEDVTEIQKPVGDAPNQSEPVYNEVDENDAIDADRASWYGSVPVGDPYYNTLEGPYQYGASPPTNNPVYNVLERSSQSLTEEGDSYSQLTTKDHVYNVLEGPDPCNDCEGPLYSNSMEVRYSNSCTNAPIYAVANDKGWKALKQHWNNKCNNRFFRARLVVLQIIGFLDKWQRSE